MSADLFHEKNEIWKKITQMSNELDDLKLSIPEQLKEAAQAKRKTSEYRNRALEAKEEAEAAAKSITLLEDSIRQTLSSVERGSVDLEDLRAKSSTLAIEVTQYHSDLIQLVESSQETIIKMTELAGQRDSLEDNVDTIESLTSDISTIEKKAKNLLNSIASIEKDADEVRDELYGYETDDEESGEEIHIKGTVEQLSDAYNLIEDNLDKLTVSHQKVKDDIYSELHSIPNDARKDFEDYLTACNEAYENSLSRIRELLPDALTTGLASAYEAKTKAEEVDLLSHKKTFSKSIIALVIISIIPFALNVARFFQGDDLVATIKDMPYLVFAMMPLYIPVLWMAYSANKSYKLSKRLIEEYTHKGVISKTFEGLSTQVNEIQDSPISQELKLKLLFNLVSVNSENPGKLISDYNKSDHPLMDALDKSSQMTDAVAKLAKIPGFTKLARHLDEKANQVLIDEERKISEAIDINSPSSSRSQE